MRGIGIPISVILTMSISSSVLDSFFVRFGVGNVYKFIPFWLLALGYREVNGSGLHNPVDRRFISIYHIS